MKKIALTQRILKNDSYFEIRETLDINWGRFCQELGFIPVILPLEYDFTVLDFDGVILTGGNDLSSVSNNETDKKRDTFEKSLIKHCIQNQISIFGVCRGMQLINEYFGGTLKKITGHAGVKHFLDNEQEVNSYHNFALDKIGEELEIVNIAQDGIVESIKHKRLKIYAQMHHPERENPFKTIDLATIKDFFHD